MLEINETVKEKENLETLKKNISDTVHQLGIHTFQANVRNIHDHITQLVFRQANSQIDRVENLLNTSSYTAKTLARDPSLLLGNPIYYQATKTRQNSAFSEPIQNTDGISIQNSMGYDVQSRNHATER